MLVGALLDIAYLLDHEHASEAQIRTLGNRNDFPYTICLECQIWDKLIWDIYFLKILVAVMWIIVLLVCYASCRDIWVIHFLTSVILHVIRCWNCFTMAHWLCIYVVVINDYLFSMKVFMFHASIRDRWIHKFYCRKWLFPIPVFKQHNFLSFSFQVVNMFPIFLKFLRNFSQKMGNCFVRKQTFFFSKGWSSTLAYVFESLKY